MIETIRYEKKSIGLSIELSIGENIGGSTGKSNTNFVPHIGRSIGVRKLKKVFAKVLVPNIGRSIGVSISK